MQIIYNYITTNIVNGKQYIGKHISDNIDNDCLGSGVILIRAIKKYGKEKFNKEILCMCPDVSTAFYNESIFIEKFKTQVPYGYNLCSMKKGISIYKKEDKIIMLKETEEIIDDLDKKLAQDYFNYWNSYNKDHNEFWRLMFSIGYDVKKHCFTNKKYARKIIYLAYKNNK